MSATVDHDNPEPGADPESPTRKADHRRAGRPGREDRRGRWDRKDDPQPAESEPESERVDETEEDGAAPVRIRGRSAREQVENERRDRAARPAGEGVDTAAQARRPVSGGVRSIDGDPVARGRAGRRRPVDRKADRLGGVAPWVPPKGRLGRRLRMREWARRGFVPLSPGRQKLRHRILPRTVIGIAFMLMATGVGAAFSGAAFYAYYDDRLAENERTVARFVEGFDQQFTDAAGALDEMRVEAVATIRGELEPLDDFVDDAGGVVGLPVTAGPSVWMVETRDEDGAAMIGSAFAVAGHRGGTALVTSYSVVRAATVEPAPDLDLLKGDRRIAAELWSWDEHLDLALLVVDEEIPTLALAGDQAQVDAVGRRVFAIGGYGGQGASAAPGVLIDHSSAGLQHTAPVGSLFNGGPLVDGQGRVLGMATTGYAPLGVAAGAVPQAPDVSGLCVSLLRCADAPEIVVPQVPGG